MKKTFKITEEHLKLLKRMYVSWWDCDYGAPSIDCKRPYGNSDVEEDICEILGKEKNDVDYESEYLTKYSKYASKLHNEMQTVLQICLSLLTFEVGEYYLTEEYDTTSWKKL